MNDYNKNTFWSCKNEETGIMKYFIKLNGTMVEVPADVYRVCFNSYRKSLRDNQRDQKYPVMNLDAFAESGQCFLELIADKRIEEREYELQIQHYVNMIKNHINQQFSEMDRTIIYEYLFLRKSSMQIANDLGMPKSTIIYRIDKIMKNLKIYLKKLVD